MLICYLIQEAKSEKPMAKVCSLVAGSRIELPSASGRIRILRSILGTKKAFHASEKP